MKYIDIHSHVNFKAFDEDRDEVMKRALENDTWVINVGTQIDTARKAVEMTGQYPEGVYAIIGLHPIHTGASYHNEKELGEGGKEFVSRGEVFDKQAYRELLKNPKVLGIGECGLDYYRMDEESIATQKEAFIAQIELANEVNKPMMLHIRNNQKQELITGKEGAPNAYFDALDLLKKHCKVKGDVHFFAGGLEEAKAFLDFGFTLSFTGVITFTTDYDEVIRNTPLDMLMTETDCPYVTPVPYRGKRNEPIYVREVVKKIALVKGLPEDEVAQAIIANAKRVFKI
ncbi:MAG TPA: TatD family hydrolase [Candidatus Paceibacterota bacterium]|jgi:TatD DNase family protein|nr:TatD family hydrolase [Candidatus Paceibacterota bacterium]